MSTGGRSTPTRIGHEPLGSRYDELRKQLPLLGKMDLSIATITLEHQGVLVTRNRQDFEQIPGLVIEDWSV